MIIKFRVCNSVAESCVDFLGHKREICTKNIIYIGFKSISFQSVPSDLLFKFTTVDETAG